MKLFVVLSALALALAVEEKVNFDGFSVYQVTPKNDKQVQYLLDLESSNLGYDFWSHVTRARNHVEIMVSPHLRFHFKDFISLTKIEYKILIENVQEVISKEKPQQRASKVFDWTRYQTLPAIHCWLKRLVRKYPGKVEVLNAGKSYEGRDLLGVKVSFNAANNKRGIFFEGGIHAREWISPATVTWMLNEVLTSTDPAVRSIVERYDWYVFPNFNPDGFVYTHTTDRAWRKTRKPYLLGYGSDPNRNWGYKWRNGGASAYSFDCQYSGTAPFSCPENKRMSTFISSIADKLVAYLAFHSYNQLLVLPYGHNGHEYASNHQQLMDIGNKTVIALAKRHGTQFRVGNTVDLLYPASGGSEDWVKHTYPGITLAYTYELRDTGTHGFLLPAEQIIPTGEETFDSIIGMLQAYEDDE